MMDGLDEHYTGDRVRKGRKEERERERAVSVKTAIVMTV